MLNASRKSCRKVLIKYGAFSALLLIGETDDVKVKALRSRQMKNFYLALTVSQVYTSSIHLAMSFDNKFSSRGKKLEKSNKKVEEQVLFWIMPVPTAVDHFPFLFVSLELGMHRKKIYSSHVCVGK